MSPDRGVTLRSGERVLIRPVRPDDKQRLLDAFDRLSPESRYRRFFAATPRLPAAQLRYFTEVDHHAHEALGAVDPRTGEGLGVARFIKSRDDPTVAEIAVAVVDDWQGKGLGTALLHQLAARAREEGVERFSAEVLAGNEPMLDLLRALGDVQVTGRDQGVIELVMDLPSAGIPQSLRETVRAAARGEMQLHQAGRMIEGAIFDVDGVLVDSPHERAWRESLRELMEGDWRDVREGTSWSPEAFTSRVYQEHVSGKPRMSGARAALAHFGVPTVDARAAVYADRKQAMVVRLIDAGEFRAFDDSLRFVADLKAAGVRVAAASSSKNADRYLARISFDGGRLLDAFDVDVSGRDFAHGKPHPEMFLTAAHELGVAPERALVIEDSPAGVEAAIAGAMAALGVARADDAALLEGAGADLVVRTLDAVDRAALAEGRLAAKRE